MKPASGTCEHEHFAKVLGLWLMLARVWVLFDLKISEGPSQGGQVKYHIESGHSADRLRAIVNLRSFVSVFRPLGDQ